MTTKSRKSATSLLIWILKNARTTNLPLQRTGLIGAMHSAETVMRHFDFTEHERLARTAPWNAVTTLFIQVGYSPETAGADMILLYASTGHSVAELRRRSMGR